MLKDKNIKYILSIIYRIEDSFVVICLSSILIIAVIQIILRNIFDSGLIWGDSLLSILVLWLGLAGSIVASRQGKHINIDVLSQYVPEKFRIYIKKTGSIFAAVVCLLISYYSFIFVSSEFDFNEYAFAQIPVWITESIIPFSFSIMGLRYFLQSIFSGPSSTIQ